MFEPNSVVEVPAGTKKVILIESKAEILLDKVILPESLEEFQLDSFAPYDGDVTRIKKNLVYFEIPDSNPNYMSKDGCLYKKDSEGTLVYYCNNSIRK